jgi:hypothetical protein
VVKAVVAVVDKGGSTVVKRGIGHSSGLNQEDLGASGINSSTLHPNRARLVKQCPIKCSMWPARNWSKISRKFLANKSGITYIGCSVALEGALYIGTTSKNSSALGVACPPPGIGTKI